MSCYFRYLKGILDEAGIEVVSGNKQQVDQAVHRIVGTNYKNCPSNWRKLKQEIITDKQKRQDFMIELTNAIK